MQITVAITQEFIDERRKWEARNPHSSLNRPATCPVAVLAKAAIPQANFVSVSHLMVFVILKDGFRWEDKLGSAGISACFTPPLKMAKWISDWDAGREVQPVTFILKAPHHHITTTTEGSNE